MTVAPPLHFKDPMVLDRSAQMSDQEESIRVPLLEKKSMPKDLLKIESTIPLPSSIPSSYLETLQEIIYQTISNTPILLREEFFNSSSFFYRLRKSLPIIRADTLDPNAFSIPISFIIPGDYTNGAARYLIDALSRWLIPGKTINTFGQISCNFRFSAHPSFSFFMTQIMIHIESVPDLIAMKKNLPILIEEIKLNIMAVYHARYITAIRSSSPYYKKMLIGDNISSILNQKGESSQNLYDQLQFFFSKSSPEEKMEEIKKNISYLMTSRPTNFDRDLFYEMSYYSTLFNNSVSSARETKHLSRVIAYHYLFKKVLSEKIETAPQERHLSLKILKTTLNGKEPVIALLCGFNFVRETERFDTKHLIEALKSCIPEARYIPESMIADRRDDKMRFFYLELTKEVFSNDEIKHIKGKLRQEILRQIENVVHPVFMPRNDEELMRNLIILNNQLKYKRDLPQVSIHYETQSEEDLTFTVLFVRLLLSDSHPLGELIQKNTTEAKIAIDDVRMTGHLKNKYPKEAAILRITLQKAPFFRPDYSVDLLRARQKIVSELKILLGEFRDFNGGIIIKQEQALAQLRALVGHITEEKELVLENYFYSLRPGVMQTVYEPKTLKAHFHLLLQTIELPLNPPFYQISSFQDGKYFLCFIKGSCRSFKEALMSEIGPLQFSSYDLSTTFLQVDLTSFFGIILRSHDPKQKGCIEETIHLAMKKWEEKSIYRL